MPKDGNRRGCDITQDTADVREKKGTTQTLDIDRHKGENIDDSL